MGIRSLNFFGILRTQELIRLANFLENVLKRNMEEKLIKVACGAQLNSRHCWKVKTRQFFFYLGSYTTWYIDCFPNNLKLQSSMLSYEICGGILTASQELMSLFKAILLGSGHYFSGVIACRRSCLQSVFSAPYPSPYGKYGGYVRFHWLAV